MHAKHVRQPLILTPRNAQRDDPTNGDHSQIRCDATSSLYQSDLQPDLPPHQARPCTDKHSPTGKHHNPAEDLQMRIRAPFRRDERSSNRVPHQGRHTDGREHRTRADADLPNVGYLRHACRGETHKRAGREAVEGCEEDDGDVASRGEPEAEDEDAGEETHEDHGIEAAYAIRDPAGKGTSEDRDGVQDGEHVGGEAHAHAVGLGVEDDVVEGEEDAEEEEEGCEDDEEEGELAQGGDELAEGPGCGVWGKAGADGEIGVDEKAKDEEGGGAHGPAEGGLVDEALDHDGEDYTTERRARDHDAEGKGAIFLEPGPY